MATFDTGRKGAVNVEINLVPIVDVMSCLTAFLLVTAVWVNNAHLKNDAKTRGESAKKEKLARVEVLIEPDALDVAFVPADDSAAIVHRALPAADWDLLAATLRDVAASEDRPHVEIAADSTREHPIEYQTLIAAMDTTVRAGFPDVGVVDPRLLAR